MNHDYISSTSREMNQKTYCSNESDKQPLDLTIKRFEAENHEVLNEKLISNLVKSQSTIKKDKQSNSELPNASYRFTMDTFSSNHKEKLNNSEPASKISRVEINCYERIKNNQDTEIGKNTPKENKMLYNSKIDLVVPENSSKIQGLLLNSGTVFSNPAPDKASQSKNVPFKNDRKVYQSSHTNSEEITDSAMKVIKQSHKISRRETCDFNEQSISNYIQDDDINCDLKENINLRRCMQSYESRLLTGISKEFRIIELPQSRNQKLQVVENFGKNSHKNIEENIALNSNNFKIVDNENTEGKILCSRESKEKNIRYIENIAAVPGPSYQKRLCSLCKKEIDEHAVLQEGKNIFMCCLCGYRSNKKHNLCKHIDSHGSEPFYCKLCGEVIKEKGTHDSEQICIVCGERFQCRTLLLEHSQIHPEYCIICWTEIDEHEFSKYRGRLDYKCCECDHITVERRDLRLHIYTHFKEKALRCVECGKRYKNIKNFAEHKKKKHPEK